MKFFTILQVSCSLDDLDNAIDPTWKVDVVYSSGYESWVTLYTVVRLYHCETKSLLSVSKVLYFIMILYAETRLQIPYCLGIQTLAFSRSGKRRFLNSAASATVFDVI